MEKPIKNWYADWFDTPFYHILYQDRDHREAQLFMDNLTKYLKLPERASILDLACGKGRHALYLNSLGYDVTGVDLSANSIAYARQFENERLHFDIHDMSIPYHKKFDAVFNLFTSFGYFDHEENNLNTLKAIKSNLNKGGHGVIDFLNARYVKENLVPEEEKSVEDITFRIKRYSDEKHILKDISFEYDNRLFSYTERVRAFEIDDFKKLFQTAGIVLNHTFGDYRLQPFDAGHSERLILIFE